MASQFEVFVNTEIPKRISTEDDALVMTEGKIPVSTGVGLQVVFKEAADIVLEGKSAYDVWLTLPGNAGKSEAEFFIAIKGDRGADGIQGEDGQGVNVLANISEEELQEIVDAGESTVGDAYIVGSYLHVFNGDTWVKSNSMQGPKGQGLNYLGEWPNAVALPLDSNFVAGDTYVWKNSLWTLVEEPTRKWVDIGVPGPTGRSAYQVWLDAGNSGSEAAFLLSLKGVKGDQGVDGRSAYQIWISNGGQGSEGTFLASLNGTNGKDGKSAYQLWLDAGNVGSNAQFLASLKGEQGERGFKGDPAVAFVIKGRVTDVAQLPTVGIATEAYYVKLELYVWVEGVWENFGELNGASAYELWTDQPGNEGKTVTEFLASLKGRDGIDGTNGRDGIDGTNGTNGKNLQVKGRRADLSVIQAIANPADQDAYTADDTGHLHIFVTPSWIDAGKFRGVDGTNGKNNFEIWEAIPANTGKTLDDYFLSLKGKDGTNGTNGTDGEDGSDGKSAYQSWLDQPGNAGKPEAEFVASMEGKSAYFTWLEIPGNEGKSKQEFIDTLNGTDGTNGTNGLSAYQVWEAQPANTGKTVQQFLTSLEGKSAYQVWLGQAGNAGKTEVQFIASIKGDRGTDGTNGKDGRNVAIKGSVANQAALPASAAEQDAYTLLDTLHLFMRISGAWVDLGSFKGEKGDTGAEGLQGATGLSINIKGEVDTDAELPDPATQEPGDSWYSVESKKLFQVNEAQVYNPGIDITGPEGLQGEQGIQGPAGKAIAIKGSYPTAAALLAADPAFVPGDGYLVGPDLYLPAPEGVSPKWYNAGPVRGPEGPQGPIGKTGLKGGIGPTGERGSLWLTLPGLVEEPTTDYGRDGDWAVNHLFDTYYRAPGTGWTLIGRLVAGDVNSPLSALGKVVRLGKNWVPLPVDEVPNLATGEVYARQLKAGGDGTQGEWVKITFPENFPETPADALEYTRSRAVGAAKGTWKPAIKDLVAKDSKQYVRTFETADSAPKWKEVTIPAAGIPEAPTSAGKTFVRSGETTAWVEYTGISAPADAKKYMRTKDAWVAFNTYDVANLTSAMTASGNWDAAVVQTIEITNTAATAKAIAIVNPPATGRTMVLVAVVRGNAGAVTFTVGGQAVKWNGGADPVYTAGFNIVTIYVIGGSTPVALGGVGMQNDSLT